MTTSPQVKVTNTEPRLYMAIELSATKWKIGFTDATARRPRIKNVDAGNLGQLDDEIAAAKQALRLDAETPVASCYEAGRDGFWIHRCLTSMGIDSHIVEPASIEVNRKKRRAKTDRIDVEKIAIAMIRFLGGDKYACRMIRIPDVEQEDARNLNREMRTLKNEKTSHTNRIRSLLVTQGITGIDINHHFPVQLEGYRTGDGHALREQLKTRLHREFTRLALTVDQIRTLQMQQAEMLRRAAKETQSAREEESREAKTVKDASHQVALTANRLTELAGIGPVTSWTLSAEVFSWRDIANRRQLAALVGLTPTPHASGEEEKEQGISKSGRAELRSLMIEVAWGWLVFQPGSELSKWYRRRFDDGTRRNRKRGIVALARKLLVALGKYVRDGEMLEGARKSEMIHFSYAASLRPRTVAAA